MLQRRALPLGWKQNRENRSAEGSEEITIQNGIEDHLPSMMHGTATCFFFFLKYYSFLRSFVPLFLRSFLPSLFLVLAALGCGRLSLPRATKRPCGYAVHVCLGVVVSRERASVPCPHAGKRRCKSRMAGLNHRPSAYEAGALPLS